MRVRRSIGFLVAAGTLSILAPPGPPAFAAQSPWVARADAICTLWQKKAVAVFGSNPKPPTTQRQVFELMLKTRPIEVGTLGALDKITLPRPPGAGKALSLAAADVREIDAGLAAYRDGRTAEFVHDVQVWQSDKRASRAFAAIGSRACT